MFNFAKITLVKQREAKDNFVGIRKSASDKGFEFCLPNGFDDFPMGILIKSKIYFLECTVLLINLREIIEIVIDLI